MRKHLVVFVEWVGHSEETLVEFHAFDGDLKDEGSHVLHVLVEGADAI